MDIRQIKLENQQKDNINKNSKNANTNINTNDNSDENTRIAISKYLNSVREYVDKITDPVSEMSEKRSKNMKIKLFKCLNRGRSLVMNRCSI